jgi:N-dimethylarginine dimethylaminohydrolase
MKRIPATAHYLMCRPDHFAVDYSINPWMDPKSWQRDSSTLAATSRKEWEGLHRAMAKLGADIELVPAVAGLPDLVFTANAAVVLDGKALLAHFRHPERQAEEPHFETAFRALKERGLITAISKLPAGIVLEGAGDCVWDPTRSMCWMGYGQRSDLAAQAAVTREFGVEVAALELADSRFYHMDTALRPLPGGELIYFPNAFTAAGRAEIRRRVDADKRIELKFEDAQKFAANCVSIGNAVILSRCSARLRATLTERGYRVIETPLDSFLRSGGSAFCLTLRLDHATAQIAKAKHAAA